MNMQQWKTFTSFRDSFSDQCAEWSRSADWLLNLAGEAAAIDGIPPYPLENPIVYNKALDEIAQNDEISHIIIGDNPGKDEQLSKNLKYLVGQAGKLGEAFFRNNPDLGTDFRKNVVILNKTPIHTAKTKHLGYLMRHGGDRFKELFTETQRWMAHETAELHKKLDCSLWLVGYGELRSSGLFSEYTSTLTEAYRNASFLHPEKQVLVFQHFSMNRFSIDLKDHYDPSLCLSDNLITLGTAHRKDILGW